MKKLFIAILSISTVIGCQKFDDSRLWSAINENAVKIAKLEKDVSSLNSDVVNLKVIIDAIQKNDMISNVSPLADGSGYTIVFISGKSIVIKNGTTPIIGVKKDTDGVIYWTVDGNWLKDESGNKIKAEGFDGSTQSIGVKKDADGKFYWTVDGEWLVDENGNKIQAEGTDGITQKIGVKKDADGRYYWTLNNDWLTDEYGNKIQAEGINGTTPQISVAPAEDGLYYWTLYGEWLIDENGKKILAQAQNGNNGITPQFKIEDNYWFISYDNEKTWTKLGKASGNNGLDGDDGDSFFKGVTIGEGYVIFTLNDGFNTQIKLPFVVDTKLAITLSEAGQLETKITVEQQRSTIYLKISGSINENDLKFITARMLALEKLDISEAKWDGSNTYMIMNPFEDIIINRTLREIVLPMEGNTCYIDYFQNLESIIFTNGRSAIEPNSAMLLLTNLKINCLPYFSKVSFQEGITEVLCYTPNEIPIKVQYHFPATLTSISFAAFKQKNIKSVTILAVTPPQLVAPLSSDRTYVYDGLGFATGSSSGSVNHDKIAATLYVPEGSVGAYEAAVGWNQFEVIRSIE